MQSLDNDGMTLALEIEYIINEYSNVFVLMNLREYHCVAQLISMKLDVKVSRAIYRLIKLKCTVPHEMQRSFPDGKEL